MVSVLLAACPFTGHVDPTVRLARALVDAGHDVRVDKADIAARVRWSGTGVTTATLTPNRRWIDNAVGKALYDNGVRATAARVGDELKAAPGAAGAVRVVEMVAAAQYLP
ncbi:hypothetical protein [Barrientosiimonas endolithica]|uniref:Glycosyltransferase n=1 Tax=Barrientosiimonas endolithica TaxID=1535208 RepID=A0ABM8HG97_9MICO|nr:hypothetical protein [Barrientosiimonas endolithica]BDZ60069.1 hypothetical protein GCM10025872_37260 [Barrientosiimonas endolithica]